MSLGIIVYKKDIEKRYFRILWLFITLDYFFIIVLVFFYISSDMLYIVFRMVVY